MSTPPVQSKSSKIQRTPRRPPRTYKQANMPPSFRDASKLRGLFLKREKEGVAHQPFFMSINEVRTFQTLVLGFAKAMKAASVQCHEKSELCVLIGPVQNELKSEAKENNESHGVLYLESLEEKKLQTRPENKDVLFMQLRRTGHPMTLFSEGSLFHPLHTIHSHPLLDSSDFYLVVPQQRCLYVTELMKTYSLSADWKFR